MGFLDKAKDAAADAVDKHGDKIAGAVDKAALVIDDKTGGKHTDKLTDGADNLQLESYVVEVLP